MVGGTERLPTSSREERRVRTARSFSRVTLSARRLTGGRESAPSGSVSPQQHVRAARSTGAAARDPICRTPLADDASRGRGSLHPMSPERLEDTIVHHAGAIPRGGGAATLRTPFVSCAWAANSTKTQTANTKPPGHFRTSKAQTRPVSPKPTPFPSPKRLIGEGFRAMLAESTPYGSLWEDQTVISTVPAAPESGWQQKGSSPSAKRLERHHTSPRSARDTAHLWSRATVCVISRPSPEGAAGRTSRCARTVACCA